MKLDVSLAFWQFCGLSVLVLFVATGVVSDLRQRRIPNALVIVMLGGGLLVHLLGPVGGPGLFTSTPGSLGAQGAFGGALAGLLLFLPLYALRAMGAGDVKFMAGIGSFAGPGDALNLALFIFAMGGALALVRMLCNGTGRRVMSNVMLAMQPVMHGSPPMFDPAKQSADRMPYALAMAAGLLAYGAWLWLGMPPPIRF